MEADRQQVIKNAIETFRLSHVNGSATELAEHIAAHLALARPTERERLRRYITAARPVIEKHDPKLHAEIMADPMWRPPTSDAF